MSLSAADRAIVQAAQRIKREERRAASRARPKSPKSPKADRGRVRDAGHLAFIRRLPCACGCLAPAPNDAAHIRTPSLAHGKPHTGMGRKPDDCWTLPLARACHERQHGGSELQFWATAGINPFDLACSLYAISGDVQAGEALIRQAHQGGSDDRS